MAFVPGFVEAIEKNQIERIETDNDGNEEIIKPKIGKDVIIGGEKRWKFCEMTRKSDIGWEAAMVKANLGALGNVFALTHGACRGTSSSLSTIRMVCHVRSIFGLSSFCSAIGCHTIHLIRT